MGAITVNDVRCVSATITTPMWGPWTADLSIALVDGPATGDRVVLKVGGTELRGTVRRGAAFAGSRRVRVVAGGGGWREVIDSKSYSHAFGVTKSTILADAARAAGEEIEVANDRVIGTAWVRPRAKAERVLRRLSGGEWYVDALGVTHVRARETTAIGTPFTVVARDGARGRFEIATEAYGDWVPGRTFTAPTVPDVQTISLVSFQAEADGKVRIIVLTADSERERMMADVRAIIASEMADFLYACMWEYKVVSATDSSVDADPSDPRMPPIRGCPTFPGLTGSRTAPAVGARVVVAFLNADPSRPIVVGMRGGAIEHLATVEGMVLFQHNFMAALCQLHGIFIGPAVAPTLPALIATALAASSIPGSPPLPSPAAEKAAQEIAGPAAASAMIAGIPGNSIALPLPYKAAIAALATKRPNYAGNFPGLGLPGREDTDNVP